MLAKIKSANGIGILSLMVFVLAITIAAFWKPKSGEEYRTYLSPDHRYKIVVYRIPQKFAMSGSGSDAPGWICLYNTSSGKLLQRKHIEMVQLVTEVTWSSTNVYVKLLADWELP